MLIYLVQAAHPPPGASAHPGSGFFFRDGAGRNLGRISASFRAGFIIANQAETVKRGAAAERGKKRHGLTSSSKKPYNE